MYENPNDPVPVQEFYQMFRPKNRTDKEVIPNEIG